MTKQVVYISPMADKPYLSLEACVQLGLISNSFSEETTDGFNLSEITAEQTESCSCPTRTKPPPAPTSLPYPAHEKSKLKQWILESYASSTFNTCTHQKLPTMSGEPLRIFLKEGVKPHAVHTPSTIPVHFRQEVKAGLDMDVRLGVIEKVPPNTPTTWCARLVIATKKNGSPRRTVDLQALNAASVRQTHHTRNPYHLAREIPVYTKKSTFDAWNRYHSVPLHSDDKH